MNTVAIIFIALSVPVLLSLPLNPTEEFQNELHEISHIFGQNFTSIVQLKEFAKDMIFELRSMLKNKSNIVILTKAENVYKILTEVDGPHNIDKLKIFKNEVKNIVDTIFDIPKFFQKAKEGFELFGTMLKLGYDFLEALDEELKKKHIKPFF